MFFLNENNTEIHYLSQLCTYYVRKILRNLKREEKRILFLFFKWQTFPRIGGKWTRTAVSFANVGSQCSFLNENNTEIHYLLQLCTYYVRKILRNLKREEKRILFLFFIKWQTFPRIGGKWTRTAVSFANVGSQCSFLNENNTEIHYRLQLCTYYVRKIPRNLKREEKRILFLFLKWFSLLKTKKLFSGKLLFFYFLMSIFFYLFFIFLVQF